MAEPMSPWQVRMNCEREAAIAAVQRVRDLHRPVELMFSGVTIMGDTIHEWRNVCKVCDRLSGALYPCDTVLALNGAARGEEQ